MIEVSTIRWLQQHAPDSDAEELADAIWLAGQSLFTAAPGQAVPAPKPIIPPPDNLPPPQPSEPKEEKAKPAPQPAPAKKTETAGATKGEIQDAGANVRVADPASPAAPAKDGASSLALRIPAGRALPGARELVRALRPFRRRVPSRTVWVLDEEETVQRIAEQRVWLPAQKPARARWLEVALVIDDAPSMVLWQDTLKEFRLLLQQLGGFRDVRTWWVDTTQPNEVVVRARSRSALPRAARELVAPDGRRLIIVASDCLGRAWDGGGMGRLLAEWGAHQPVAIFQMLPQQLWRRTALDPYGRVQHVHAGATEAGAPNHRLRREAWRARRGAVPPTGVPIPVFTSEAELVTAWARLIHRATLPQMPAVILPTQPGGEELMPSVAADPIAPPVGREGALALVREFQSTATPLAFRLAGLLAAAPLRLPVMRLIQRVLLPESRQVHLAEFFLSGLIRRVTPTTANSSTVEDPDLIDYEFIAGVRELFLDGSIAAESVQVQQAVSHYLNERFGQTIDFLGIIDRPSSIKQSVVSPANGVFARVSGEVLRRLGGPYAEAARYFATGESVKSTTGGTAPPLRPLEGAAILWVDDHPENNGWEVLELKEAGAILVTASSTTEALGTLRGALRFDAVISDLKRGEDEYAGFELLDAVRRSRNPVPFAIFAYRTERVEQQATDKGALICTNVFREVQRALEKELAVRRGTSPPPLRLLPPRCEANVRELLKNSGVTSAWTDETRMLEELFILPATSHFALLWQGAAEMDEPARSNFVAAVVEAATEAGYVQIWKVESNAIRLQAASILPGKNSYDEASWDGVIGRAARTGETQWLPEVKRDPGYIAAEPSTESELALPIVAQTKAASVTGVINIECPRVHAFGPLQILWLEQLAHSLALAFTAPAATPQPNAPSPPLRKPKSDPVRDLHAQFNRLPRPWRGFIAARAAWRLYTLLPPAQRETRPGGELDEAQRCVEFAELAFLHDGHGPISEWMERLRAASSPDTSEEDLMPRALSIFSTTAAILASDMNLDEGLSFFVLIDQTLRKLIKGRVLDRKFLEAWHQQMQADFAAIPDTPELNKIGPHLPDLSWLDAFAPLGFLPGEMLPPYPAVANHWVLIAGLGQDKLPPDLQRTSEWLGYALAAAGFGLIAGGWPGVDHYVTRGYLRRLELGRRNPEVWLTQVLEPGRTPSIAAGKIETAESVSDSLRHSVQLAQAVVLIHGAGGTARVARLAEEEEVPLFPLRATGGDAEKFYQLLSFKTLISATGIPKPDLQLLALPALSAVAALPGELRRVLSQRPARSSTPPQPDSPEVRQSVVSIADASGQIFMTGFILAQPRVILTDGWPANVQHLSTADIFVIDADGKQHAAKKLGQIETHPFGPLILSVPSTLTAKGLKAQAGAMRLRDEMTVVVAAGQSQGPARGPVLTAEGRIEIPPAGLVPHVVHLRMVVHPGSSGAPVLDAQSRVTAFVIAAGKDTAICYPAEHWLGEVERFVLPAARRTTSSRPKRNPVKKRPASASKLRKKK